MERIWLVPILLVLTACTSVQKERMLYERVLKFESNPAPLIPHRIQQVDYLALEFSESVRFAHADKLVFKNDLIYIGDFRNSKVVVYDRSGNLKFVVDRRGRGHGEYLEMKSFSVGDEGIHIIDNFRGKVCIYDSRTGEFIGTKKLPIVAWDIEALGNGDFILACVPLGTAKLKESQPNYRIFITDKDFAVKRRLFEFEKDYCEPFGQKVYFTVCGDSLVFSSFRFDGFTVFDRTTASDFYHVALDFDRKIPDKYHNDAQTVINSNFAYLVATPVLCKDLVSIDISSGDYLEHYLYDPQLGAFIANDAEDRTNFLFPPIGSIEGKFVSLLPEDGYDELIEKGFRPASPDIEQKIRKGETVLLFYSV